MYNLDEENNNNNNNNNGSSTNTHSLNRIKMNSNAMNTSNNQKGWWWNEGINEIKGVNAFMWWILFGYVLVDITFSMRQEDKNWLIDLIFNTFPTNIHLHKTYVIIYKQNTQKSHTLGKAEFDIFKEFHRVK